MEGHWPAPAIPTTAVFSAAQAPGQIILLAHDLAQSWRHRNLAVLSGFHSSLEKEVWDVLWPEVRRNAGMVVLVRVLARGMLKRLPLEEQTAVENGRLLLLSPFADSVRRATRQTAYRRNLVAAALADTVLILHAHAGSSTFRLAEEVLGWGKAVYTLDVPANRPLLELGAGRFEEGLLLKQEEAPA